MFLRFACKSFFVMVDIQECRLYVVRERERVNRSITEHDTQSRSSKEVQAQTDLTIVTARKGGGSTVGGPFGEVRKFVGAG